MNTQPTSIFGRKLGCTQIFNADGTVQRVTVVASRSSRRRSRSATTEKHTKVHRRPSSRLRGAQREAHDARGRWPLQEGRDDAEAAREGASLRRGVRRQVGSGAAAQARRDLRGGPARRRARDDAGPRLHRRRASVGLRRRGDDARDARVPAPPGLDRHEHDAGPHAAEPKDGRPVRQRDGVHVEPQGRARRCGEASAPHRRRGPRHDQRDSARQGREDAEAARRSRSTASAERPVIRRSSELTSRACQAEAHRARRGSCELGTTRLGAAACATSPSDRAGLAIRRRPAAVGVPERRFATALGTRRRGSCWCALLSRGRAETLRGHPSRDRAAFLHDLPSLSQAR